MMREQKRKMEHEQQRLMTGLEEINNSLKLMEMVDVALGDAERLRTMVEERDGQLEEAQEQLRESQEQLVEREEQLKEAQERVKRMEIQMGEMTKFSVSVTGKTPHEDILKALTTFVKKSKRKRLEKRVMVKEIVMDFANANGIVLPEDLAEMIYALDDDEPQETKVVHVMGNYNDIHDNGDVDINE